MSKGLSVALLHYTAPPVVGGVEQVLGQHARLLADAGNAVRIVAGRGASQDPRIAFVRVAWADTRHPDVVQLQADLDAGRVPAALAAVAAALADELTAALDGVDVVIAHNVGSLNWNLALTTALHDILGRPDAPRGVLWQHDLAWTLPAYRRRLHPGRPWDLLREPWPGVTQVTVSEARRADLAALMGLDPATIRVVPNGVDLAGLLGLAPATLTLARRVGLLAFDPLVLLPARITPRKNVEQALRVVAAMRAEGRPAAGLVVTGPVDPHEAGASRYLDALVALRQDLGLTGAAVFLVEELVDPAAEALVHDLYRLADLLLLPSRDEGFGIPILEAAAHRLPIVCSDLQVLRDLAGDAAVYVAPDADPSGVAALALARLDGDPLVTFARRVRTEFAWEAVYRRGIAPLLTGPGTPVRSARRRPARGGTARSR
jgi:glycosyltransferase involved in cell wall biosynthesis